MNAKSFSVRVECTRRKYRISRMQREYRCTCIAYSLRADKADTRVASSRAITKRSRLAVENSIAWTTAVVRRRSLAGRAFVTEILLSSVVTKERKEEEKKREGGKGEQRRVRKKASLELIADVSLFPRDCHSDGDG